MPHPLDSRPVWYNPVLVGLLAGFFLGLVFTITADSATVGLMVGVLSGVVGFIVTLLLFGARGKTPR